MPRHFGRVLLLSAAAIGAIIVGVKLANIAARPPTKLVSSALPVPIDVATASFDVHLWSGHVRGSVPAPDRAAYFSELVIRGYSIYPADFF
jgi:hypothetical protein